MPALQAMLDVAVAAAHKAGAIIRAAAADPGALQVRSKQPNDFVTQIDLACERAIVEALLGAYPSQRPRP